MSNNGIAEERKPINQVYIQKETQEEIFSVTSINEDKNDNTIDNYNLKTNIIGSAFSTFILVESDKQLYIIDQHAAHERLIYEQLKESISKQQVVSQQLLLHMY